MKMSTEARRRFKSSKSKRNEFKQKISKGNEDDQKPPKDYRADDMDPAAKMAATTTVVRPNKQQRHSEQEDNDTVQAV